MSSEHILTQRLQAAAAHIHDCRPAFYRTGNAECAARFTALLTDNPQITVFDTLHGQVEELIRIRIPTRKLTSAEMAIETNAFYDGHSPDTCGVWVYYSWANRVVHILDEADFSEIRTNRNLYKITLEEQQKLADYRIGIVGLSVGQSVALTLAMERGFGELRIADFDAIELTNLNRIRAGIHTIGVPKVVVVAREIAEIDPYLKVTCFAGGLTEENMDAFFGEGGKLNILIDECDSLDIKLLARSKARELRVPVIMETSDRGMTDVERFDLEPERPILHGLVEHLETRNIRGLTNELKVPYILSMIGVDTMSDRMLASLLEVEQSVASWPQLASDVVIGGGIIANVSRRIALGQCSDSGRYFVDVDSLVASQTSALLSSHASGADDSCDSEANYTCRDKSILSEPITSNIDAPPANLERAKVKELVEAAVLAPSGGNSQPWRWRSVARMLSLDLDTERTRSFLDFQQTGSYMSLGAAAENVVLKGHDLGLEVMLQTFRSFRDPNEVAEFRFFEPGSCDNQPIEPHVCDALVTAIGGRLTNRRIGERQEIQASYLEELQSLVNTIPGAMLTFFTDHQQLKELGKVISGVDRALLTDQRGHRGFINEIRWTPEEAERTRDGVDLRTIDLTAAEAAGFQMARKWSVVEQLAKFGGGSAFEKLSCKSISAATAVGLLTMPEFSPVAYFEAGRALQRVWLRSHQLGLSLHPMSAAPFLFSRLLHGGAAQLTANMRRELSSLHQLFVCAIGVNDQRQNVFLFRLFKAGSPAVRAIRRPVEEVLTFQDQEIT